MVSHSPIHHRAAGGFWECRDQIWAPRWWEACWFFASENCRSSYLSSASRHLGGGGERKVWECVSDPRERPSGNRKWIRTSNGQTASDCSHLAVLWGLHPIQLGLIDQQALRLDSRCGCTEGCIQSKSITGFPGWKSSSEKACLNSCPVKFSLVFTL